MKIGKVVLTQRGSKVIQYANGRCAELRILANKGDIVREHNGVQWVERLDGKPQREQGEAPFRVGD